MQRWPLAGRIEEQAYLGTVISDPNAAGVVVAGKAGVGKTRLVREVVEVIGEFHREFVTATASARQLPFGAFAHILPEDLGGVDQLDLLAVIGRHLVNRAEGRTTILAVDDVHLLDQFSAALVHHIATNRLATVVLTVRSGEDAPDAIVALHRDGIVSRLELQPISRIEFDELVETVLEGPTDGLTLDRLWDVTKGNALFLRELMADALTNGTLFEDHDMWRWSPQIRVAARIQEAVSSRLGNLAPAERRLLELLAIGEPIPFTSVQRLVPDVSMAELERRDVIVVEGVGASSEVRLAHPLFGEAMRAALPKTQLLQINRDLADELTPVFRNGQGDILKLASLQEAGGESVDPELLVEAARRANLLSDHELAERLARAAIGRSDKLSAELELGLALVGQFNGDEAESVLRPLIGQEPHDVFREQLADGLSRAMKIDIGRDRIDEILETLESIEVTVTDPGIKALIQCHRATWVNFSARPVEAIELGLKALASVDDERVQVRMVSSLGMGLTMVGRNNEALAYSESALEVALRLSDRLPRGPGWVIQCRAVSLYFAGRIEEAIDLIDFGMSSLTNPPVSLLADANALRGRCYLSLGRPRSALRLLRDSVTTAQHFAGTVQPSWCMAQVAEAHALLGQATQSKAAAEESRSLHRSGFEIFQPDELRALAWVDAQVGGTSSAIKQLRAAADLAADHQQYTFEIAILGDLMRLGDRDAVDRTLESASRVDGSLSSAVALHAEAVRSASAAELELAAAAFGAIGCSLVAAELWVSASAAYQQTGFRNKAAAASRQTSTLIEQCEGAYTPWLNRAAGQETLTRRERETAALAAGGATNVEIAELLSVSVRTVESHLYCAFGKLGITERSQISDAMEAPSPLLGPTN